MNGAPISPRVSSLRPTAVNRVLAEVKALQATGRDLVSLMRGQPDTPTPPHVVEAAIKALRDGRTGYPDNLGEPALRGGGSRPRQLAAMAQPVSVCHQWSTTGRCRMRPAHS